MKIKADWKVLIAGLLIAAIGLVVHFEKKARLNQYNWIAAQVPVQPNAGFVASASFTTQLNQDYEIEIAVLENGAEDDQIKRLISTTESPSPLDIDWKVMHNNNLVAEGNSHDYIYIKRTRYSPRSSFLKKIGFGTESEKIHQGDTVARGVGKFSAIEDKLFRVEVQVGKTFIELSNAVPVLRVRINRKFALRYYSDITASAKMSTALLGLSVMLVGWYLLTLIWNKFLSNK